MGRVEEKKKLKKDALMNSAFLLFTQKGLSETTVLDITKKANMAKGTFYLYFKDKSEIRDELIKSYSVAIFNEARLEIGDETKLTFQECIHKILDGLINKFIENPDLLRFIDKNLSWGLIQEIRISDADNKTPFEILGNLAERKGVKFRDENLMYYMVIEMVSTMCHSSILDKIPADIGVVRPELHQVVERIINQFTT